MRGFRGKRHAWRRKPTSVSIPRRVLRGFRDTLVSGPDLIATVIVGFNTPEGVEGFSRRDQGDSGQSVVDIEIPEVSIPRRVDRVRKWE